MSVHSPEDQAEAELAIADASGLVTAAVETLQPSFGSGSRSVHLGLLPGDDRTLAAFVAVAGCQRRPSLTLSGTADRLLIGLDSGPRADGGCDAVSVEYGVLLSLRNPIVFAGVVTHDEDTDAATWGVAAMGTDGMPLPLLIIDRTRRTVSIEPAPAGSIDLGGDDIEAAIPNADPSTVVLAWSRDSCETETTLTIEESAEIVDLSINSARVEPRVCGNGQISHAIRLRFDVPIPAEAVVAKASHSQ